MKVLVTGSTGFLGSHVAQVFPDVDVTYLVRRPVDRPHIIGDLNTPITGNFTHVINIAAQAKWGNDDLIYQTNVLATGRFMDHVSRLDNLERVIHVGTAFTAGRHKDCSIPELQPQTSVDHFNVYTQSKNQAVDSLRKLIPDVTVIAPSIICGHTNTGVASSTQIWWIFDLIHKLGAFTNDIDQKIDVVPVDHVSNVIINELLNPTYKPYIHATAGDQANTFREILTEFDRLRGTDQVSGYQQLPLNQLSEVVHAKYAKRLADRLMNAITMYSEFADAGMTFDTAIKSPSFVSYLSKCVTDQTISAMMREDYTGK